MIGEISDTEKPAFLSGAIGLLMPIDWAEPFGLMMIEAMACGTPVIAFNRGSVPEIIEDGTTGFIVGNEDEAIQAVSRLPQMSNVVVRCRFEQRFTARQMAENYVGVYKNLIAASQISRGSQPAHVEVRPPSKPRLHGAGVARLGNAASLISGADIARLGSTAFIPIASSASTVGLTDGD